jgi:hypothetical protein
MKNPTSAGVVPDVERFAGLLVIVAVMALCACASKSRTAGEEVVAGTTPRAATVHDARRAFVTCVKRHGVRRARFRRGRVEIAGTERRVRSATRVCAFLLPPADSNITPAEAARFRRRMLAFTRCMRAHGVDLPNPTLRRLPGGFEVSYQKRRGEAKPEHDPMWNTGLAACRDLNPLLRASP